MAEDRRPGFSDMLAKLIGDPHGDDGNGGGGGEETVAATITVNANLEVESGQTLLVHGGAALKTISWTGDQYVDHAQPIGTTEEQIDIGELTAATLGWATLTNMGTNISSYIELRVGSGTANRFARLYGGESMAMRMMFAAVPYAIFVPATHDTNTTCRLRYLILEN